MSNEINLLTNFDFGGFPVRVVGSFDEPWFIAQDVCDALDISNSRHAVSRLDDDEKGVVTSDTLGGVQEVLTVSESGLPLACATTSTPCVCYHVCQLAVARLHEGVDQGLFS